MFNGSSTCVAIPGTETLTSSGPFTVSAFVNVTVFSKGTIAGSILSKARENFIARSWRSSSDTVSNFSFKIGGTSDTDIGTADGRPSNVWIHVAAVFEPGKRMEVWVDGVLGVRGNVVPAAVVDDPAAFLLVGCIAGSTSSTGRSTS